MLKCSDVVELEVVLYGFRLHNIGRAKNLGLTALVCRTLHCRAVYSAMLAYVHRLVIWIALFFGASNSLKSRTLTGRGVVMNSRLMAGGNIPYVPYFPNKASKDYQWMDIYNALGRERTLFVSRYLEDESCNQLIASLIWLQGQSELDPITMYFNVPGSVSRPAMAVYDVMSRLKCPVVTINAGLTVGMGALLCAAGTRGKRYALPNSRFLMSRSGLDEGIEGQAADIHLQVEEVRFLCCGAYGVRRTIYRAVMWCRRS
jgi:ATP-dependent Clp endopeptidase proteolytic subunit ClpP